MKPTQSGQDRWVPKAFRPEAPPTVEELLDLLHGLSAASVSTKALFRRLSEEAPACRVRAAAVFTIDCMRRNPLLSNVLQQALTIDEYSSLQELLTLQLTQRQRHTAERLLCIRERELVSSFFRVVFRSLGDYDDFVTHPFDEV